jgi:mutator protein MutT
MLLEHEKISAGFLIKDKKVFVAQRNKNDEMGLKWEFPGGTLKDDEQYDEALIREFQEEFQIKITVIKEIGGAETNYNGKVYIFAFLLIEGEIDKIKLISHSDSKFVTLEELKKLDMPDADKSFITKYENEIKEYIN